MNLLILGGTGEAKLLTKSLSEFLKTFQKQSQGDKLNTTEIIYSVAGLVRIPQLPCKIISGGFSQYATSDDSNISLKNNGFENYIQDNQISAILDATHPYAKNISETAAATAKKCAIPYWQYLRPPWEKQQGDQWQLFKQWDELLPHLVDKSSVFFSSGQVSAEIFNKLDELSKGNKQTQLLRTAVKPAMRLAENIHWIKGIGPFHLEDEISLLKKHKVDAIVTKNSGGNATSAKLQAARQLGIPVLMLSRPELPVADKMFNDITDCQKFLIEYFSSKYSA